MKPVDLPKSYRLLNHGPTVLVTTAHGTRRNVMAAAWAMPIDFDPPKVAVVIDKNTYTRELIDASGVFTLNVPTASQIDLTHRVGTRSGRDCAGGDKFAELGADALPGRAVDVPWVAGCVAWLEGRVLPEPDAANKHDLFIAEVLAAWADEDVFSAGRWHFDASTEDKRSIHHVAGGAFFLTGPLVEAS